MFAGYSVAESYWELRQAIGICCLYDDAKENNYNYLRFHWDFRSFALYIILSLSGLICDVNSRHQTPHAASCPAINKIEIR